MHSSAHTQTGANMWMHIPTYRAIIVQTSVPFTAKRGIKVTYIKAFYFVFYKYGLRTCRTKP
jgi:hypothetical protein